MAFIIILILLSAAILIASYFCYRYTFISRCAATEDPYILMHGEQYTALREPIHALISKAVELPYEDMHTLSHDGLTLHARYYELSPTAPLMIMFHGYRSHPLRDLCAMLALARDMGFNTLLVDQRGHGESEGNYLSFCIKEGRDVKTWSDYASEYFGEDRRIFLFGISMGAASVLLSSSMDMPRNVCGIIADCGFTDTGDILRNVIRAKKLPLPIVYPLIRLGAKLYGDFDIEQHSIVEAVSKTEIPILFIHGDDDRLIPYSMTEKLYESCASQKDILIVHGAGHTLCYFIDSTAYEKAVRSFVAEHSK